MIQGQFKKSNSKTELGDKVTLTGTIKRIKK